MSKASSLLKKCDSFAKRAEAVDPFKSVIKDLQNISGGMRSVANTLYLFLQRKNDEGVKPFLDQLVNLQNKVFSPLDKELATCLSMDKTKDDYIARYNRLKIMIEQMSVVVFNKGTGTPFPLFSKKPTPDTKSIAELFTSFTATLAGFAKTLGI